MLLNHTKTPGFLASREEFNPGQRGGLIVQSFCVIKLKDSDAGRDWGQEEKGTTEDEIAGWHH